MAESDNVRLNEGYAGATSANKTIDGEAGTVAGLQQKQQGLSQDLQGSLKGNFATSAINGSHAASNTLGAGSDLHAANARAGQRFVKTTSQHEETASTDMSHDANNLATFGEDLYTKIKNSGA